MLNKWWQRWQIKFSLLLALPVVLLLVISRQAAQRPSLLPGLGGAVTAIAYSSDGQISCATDNRFVQVWKPDSQRWRSFIKSNQDNNDMPYTSLFFSKESGMNQGEQLIAGGYMWPGSYGSNQNTIWDFRTRRELFIAGFSCGGEMALSPDGKTLATSGHDQVYLYDLTAKPVSRKDSYGRMPELLNPKTLVGPKSGFILALAISPDGKTLAGSSGSDQPIFLWDMTTRKLINQLTIRTSFSGASNSSNTVSGSAAPGFRDTFLTFSRDGQSLVRDTLRGAVERWDLTSNQLAASVPANTTIIADTSACQAEFSPDGKQLATSDSYGIVLRDTKSLKEIRRFGVTGPIAFSPNSTTLATGHGNAHEILLWHLD